MRRRMLQLFLAPATCRTADCDRALITALFAPTLSLAQPWQRHGRFLCRARFGIDLYGGNRGQSTPGGRNWWTLGDGPNRRILLVSGSGAYFASSIARHGSFWSRHRKRLMVGMLKAYKTDINARKITDLV
eukprot:m.440245 g.440245  ORF g.440245 m.440245 type:complete len:131 (+) comp21465_c0_seq9:114-506(+)